MKTLTIKEAANFLQIHPQTLRNRAACGDIPGAKIGRAWVFIEVDIADYLRSQYHRRTLQGDGKETSCHSTNAKTLPSGGLKSPWVDEQYNAALGLKINLKPRNTTTG